MLQRLFYSDKRVGPGIRGMTPALRLGLIASGLLHLAVMVLLLIGLSMHTPKDEEPVEPAVAMVFESTAQTSVRAPVQSPVSLPAKDNVPPTPPARATPEPRPTEAQPIEAPPPPPPPPLQSHVEPAPQIPTPPRPALPPEPLPAPNVAPVPPTPPTPAPPTPAPPTPAPQTPAPAKAEPPLPLPPPLVPQPPAQTSTTAQPNPAKNPTPNSSSVENTLERLRQQMARSEPAKNRPNPQATNQPNGGNPLANDTAALSVEQRGAIGDHVRECWTKDAGALDIDKQRVLLTVTTDAGGVARRAEVAGDDVGRMGEPRFRAFAERARRAIMDPRCASLPLPNKVLGKVNILTFRFSP